MKISNKILFLSSITIIIFLLFASAIFIINSNSNLAKKAKSLISTDTKMFLKRNVFVHEYNKEILKQLRKDKLEIYSKNSLIAKLIKKQKNIEFKKNEKVKIFNIDGTKYSITRYATNYLTRSYPYGINVRSSSFIEALNEDIWLVTADGTIIFFTPENLKKGIFEAKILKSNIENILIDSKIYKDKSEFGIKDILIKNNQLYVSYTNEIKSNCYNISILKTEINKTYLNFEKFYEPSFCVNEKNKYGEFHAIQSGGRMKFLDENNLLLTTGEFRYRILAQDKNKIFGKILKINIENKSTEVLGMGLRNSQGLFVDKKNNLIFLTDHGPLGGDEINVLNLNNKIVENFGWPIASYGEHYHASKHPERYSKAPLYKSHIKYDFKEPIKYFEKSIGISEILKINNDFFDKKDEKIRLLVSSLGDNISEGDMSLHYLVFDKEFNGKQHEIININNRIRDLKYLKKEKKIILFLENAELALIEKI